MAFGECSRLELLDGGGDATGADADRDELPVRSLQAAVVLAAVAKMFTHQELQEPHGR